MRAHNCWQCTSGWVPGTPKTFAPWCRGCQDKKAAGLRTGAEPVPLKYGRKHYDNAKRFHADLEGRKRARVVLPRSS